MRYKNLVLAFALMTFLGVGVFAQGVPPTNYSYSGPWISPGNLVDGNWSTSASVQGSIAQYIVSAQLYTNYTVPSGATSAILQMKDYYTIANLSATNNRQNVSLSSDYLQGGILKIFLNATTIQNGASGNPDFYYAWDYANSSWNLIRVGGAEVYGQAVFWNVNSTNNQNNSTNNQSSQIPSYQAGSSAFNLPQISVKGTYPNDSMHHTYFACATSLDGSANVVGMNQSGNCPSSSVSFDPTSSEIGNHTYSAAIEFVSRAFNANTGQWQTVANGTDNKVVDNFQVVGIPKDNFSVQNWVNGLLQEIKQLFCKSVGLFC